jgi:predicted GNAT family N-acyltransferase
VLGAQVSAVPLYERAGYTTRSDVFLDAGIEHVWMEKQRA